MNSLRYICRNTTYAERPFITSNTYVQNNFILFDFILFFKKIKKKPDMFILGRREAIAFAATVRQTKKIYCRNHLVKVNK